MAHWWDLGTTYNQHGLYSYLKVCVVHMLENQGWSSGL